MTTMPKFLSAGLMVMVVRVCFNFVIVLRWKVVRLSLFGVHTCFSGNFSFNASFVLCM